MSKSRTLRVLDGTRLANCFLHQFVHGTHRSDFQLKNDALVQALLELLLEPGENLVLLLQLPVSCGEVESVLNFPPDPIPRQIWRGLLCVLSDVATPSLDDEVVLHDAALFEPVSCAALFGALCLSSCTAPVLLAPCLSSGIVPAPRRSQLSVQVADNERDAGFVPAKQLHATDTEQQLRVTQRVPELPV